MYFVQAYFLQKTLLSYYPTIILCGHGTLHSNLIDFSKQSRLELYFDLNSMSRLLNVWQDMFPTNTVDIFSTQRCPMLIGIMRGSPVRIFDPLNPAFRYEILLENDSIRKTKERSSLMSVSRELGDFKREFDQNEKILVRKRLLKSIFIIYRSLF